MDTRFPWLLVHRGVQATVKQRRLDRSGECLLQLRFRGAALRVRHASTGNSCRAYCRRDEAASCLYSERKYFNISSIRVEIGLLHEVAIGSAV